MGLIARNITGTIKKADGSAWAGAEVKFSISDTQADGAIVVPGITVKVVTNAAGVFTAALYTLSGSYLNYTVMLPGGDSQDISLPDAVGTADLAALLQIAASAPEIAIRKASTTALGGVRIDGTTITIDAAGVISAASGASNLDGLTDVVITSAAAGEYLRHNGVNWVDAPIQAGDLPTAIDAAKLGDGLVSNLEFGYLNGVTSAIQTQLDGKSPVSHNHDASYQPLDSDLTAIAVLAPLNDDILQRKLGAWTNRTPAQLKTDLALTKSDVGLGNVDNTSDVNKPVSTATQTALNGKLAIAGNLSDLNNAATARSNLGFEPAVRVTPLTGLGVGTNSAIAATDTILQAFAKLQSQIDFVGGSGDVVGPASATDNALARFDTTTGKLIQNSAATLSDTGALQTASVITNGVENIAPNGLVFTSNNVALRFSATNCNHEFLQNGASKLTIDGTTHVTDTAVLIYLNGVSKRVSVGAVDSGGTGFKVLRVPN